MKKTMMFGESVPMSVTVIPAYRRDEKDEAVVSVHKTGMSRTRKGGRKERIKQDALHPSERSKKNAHRNRGFNPHYYNKFVGWGWETVTNFKNKEKERVERSLCEKEADEYEIAIVNGWDYLEYIDYSEEESRSDFEKTLSAPIGSKFNFGYVMTVTKK